METIEDILREIRKKNQRKFYPAEYGGGEVSNMMRDLADRIEEATKALRADNAKLKEERTYLCAKALEPVLAVMPSAWAVTNRFSLMESKKEA